MASILKGLWTRLTGGGRAEPEERTCRRGGGVQGLPHPARALLRPKGGFQTAGVIEKDFETGTKEHRFVRAETHPSKDDAAAFAVAKGRQIIDEQGDRIFR